MYEGKMEKSLFSMLHLIFWRMGMKSYTDNN